MAAAITHVLSVLTGPIATGDPDALKEFAEKRAAEIVGVHASYKWEPAGKNEDGLPEDRLELHRTMSGRWISIGCFIDAVPRLATKTKKARG